MVESTNQSNGSNPFDTIRSIYTGRNEWARFHEWIPIYITGSNTHTTIQYTYNIVWEGMDESMNGMEWITTSNKYSTYSNDSLSINTHISTYKYKYSIDDSIVMILILIFCCCIEYRSILILCVSAFYRSRQPEKVVNSSEQRFQFYFYACTL